MCKKIYVGYSYDNQPIMVLLAESQEKASLVAMGMNEVPNSWEEIDPADPEVGMYGVGILLTSTRREVIGSPRHAYYKMKRGK